ncbi:rab-GTPase-TBC domain-containing protein [Chlamydoabsidia padenii]|nr:rab-GTPase-TBC domain-containing protein [Chlamydoabsidia padenii]
MGGGKSNSPPVYYSTSTSMAPNPGQAPSSSSSGQHETSTSAYPSSSTTTLQNSITSSRRQTQSIPTASSSPKTVQLIYTKSDFFLKKEGHAPIRGYFTIISNNLEEYNVVVFLAWIPEYLIDPVDLDKFITLDNVLASHQGFPSIQLHMGYDETILVDLRNIKSLKITPPKSPEVGSIVITTAIGHTLRPLWYEPFHPIDSPWPGYNIVDIINAFVDIKMAGHNVYIFPVMTESELTSASYSEPRPTTASLPLPPSVPHTDPIYDSLQEAKWTIFERLSRITRASRNTADHPVAQPILPLLPLSVQSLSRNGTVQETLKDYNVASYYLTQWAAGASHGPSSEDELNSLLSDMPEMQQAPPRHTRRDPITPEEWIDFFDQDGVFRVTRAHVHKLVFQGGLHSDIRIEAWKFLLGIYPWDSTFDEREAIRRSKAEEYFAIKAKWFNDTETRNTQHFLDEKHRIDKDVHRTDRDIAFFEGEDLPNPDPQMAVGTNENLEIMKDILVTYDFYNTTLGYVQGMSDLCAPMFVGMGDEAMAFWGFVNFMDRVQSNFYTDQSGMHRQLKTLNALIRFMDPALYKHFEETETTNLFFCFRWLLVWFKREFDWDDVIRLWEVLWTDHLSPQFLLFVAMAVLHQHRDTILTELGQFDELLKYINELMGNISLNKTLETAEVLYYQFERRIKATDRKHAQLQEKLQQRVSLVQNILYQNMINEDRS